MLGYLALATVVEDGINDDVPAPGRPAFVSAGRGRRGGLYVASDDDGRPHGTTRRGGDVVAGRPPVAAGTRARRLCRRAYVLRREEQHVSCARTAGQRSSQSHLLLRHGLLQDQRLLRRHATRLQHQYVMQSSQLEILVGSGTCHIARLAGVVQHHLCGRVLLLSPG